MGFHVSLGECTTVIKLLVEKARQGASFGPLPVGQLLGCLMAVRWTPDTVVV